MIAKAAIESGQQVPDDCIPPPIPEECLFAYVSFSELSTDRQIGFATGPIPHSAIREFCLHRGMFSIDEFDLFVFMIRALENAQASTKTTATSLTLN